MWIYWEKTLDRDSVSTLPSSLWICDVRVCIILNSLLSPLLFVIQAENDLNELKALMHSPNAIVVSTHAHTYTHTHTRARTQGAVSVLEPMCVSGTVHYLAFSMTFLDPNIVREHSRVQI